MCYQNGLTIVIPTYNRENQLKNQLKSIFAQDVDDLVEIIIIDNNSNYDISNIVKHFNPSLIRIVVNPFNIRAHSNVANAFYYCNTEWFWLLSDDDETTYDSINLILDEIVVSPKNTGMIKFSKSGFIQKEKTVNNLKEYIDYYYNEKDIRRGDLVFMSTNVYNIKNIHEYLGYAFEFSYTYIPQLIPIFKGLDDNKISVRFSSTPIAKYIPPREGNYSFGTVGKGLSTLSHLPLNLNKKYRKKFLNICMSITYSSLMSGLLTNKRIDNIEDFKIIYNNIYRYYIPWSGKITVNLFFILMATSLTRKLTFSFYKLIKS